MRTYFFLFLTLGFALVLHACTIKTERNSSATETSYFDQEPPGVTPEVFAPGIISINGRHEHGISFSPDLDETVPSITPDGKYLFFSQYNEEGGLSNFYWASTEVIEKLRPK